MPTQIRLARIDDAQAIATVHVASWRETYAGLLPAAMLANLSVADRASIWQKILDQNNPVRGTPFVAEHNGSVVGFAHALEQRTPSLKTRGFTGEVASIYILRAFQRQGIGTALMKKIGSPASRQGPWIGKPVGLERKRAGAPVL